MKKTVLCVDDLPDDVAALWLHQPAAVACDIETTGLEWNEHSIASCQMTAPDGPVYVVRTNGERPVNIQRIVQSPTTPKIFHHAMFDLGFMFNQWQIVPANVQCTKIASKILDPTRRNHSLKSLLAEKLDIHIDKTMRRSNWTAHELSAKQIAYAATDVAHLHRLCSVMREELRAKGLLQMLDACFGFIPWRVQLVVKGIGDVFQY
jgi:ribonuclease D